MKNNALVLLWKGETIPDYLVKDIADILISHKVCIPELLTIKYKDEEGVTDALISATTTKNDSVAEAVKQSVIYIGKRFESSLVGTNGNLAMFALELSTAVSQARERISFNPSQPGNEILNAIEILSTTNAIIPSTLARKYHFNKNVVDIIKKVYNNVP